MPFEVHAAFHAPRIHCQQFDHARYFFDDVGSSRRPAC